MRRLPRSATNRRPCESIASECGPRNCAVAVALRAPALDELAVGRTSRCGRCRSVGLDPGTARCATRRRRCCRRERSSTSFGSVNCVGGSPASPGVPSTSSTLPCGLNFVTVWPLPAASGNFFSSGGVAERASATQTLPWRSTSMPCGQRISPAPKLCTTLPVGSSLTIGSTSSRRTNWRRSDRRPRCACRRRRRARR